MSDAETLHMDIQNRVLSTEEIAQQFAKLKKQYPDPSIESILERLKAAEDKIEMLLHTKLLINPSIKPAQVCPVCNGRTTMPHNFYIRDNTSAINTMPTACRSCSGTGFINNL